MITWTVRAINVAPVNTWLFAENAAGETAAMLTAATGNLNSRCVFRLATRAEKTTIYDRSCLKEGLYTTIAIPNATAILVLCPIYK